MYSSICHSYFYSHILSNYIVLKTENHMPVDEMSDFIGKLLRLLGINLKKYIKNFLNSYTLINTVLNL